MDDLHFDYDELVQASLKGVIRGVLEHVAEHGLPGEHHFYITFDTSFEGVSIPAYLRERYPDDMTIVLQKGFWGLIVGENEFEVNLAFDQKPELLVIPFAALIAFVDPAAQFALQFQSDLYPANEDAAESGDENEYGAADDSIIAAPTSTKVAPQATKVTETANTDDARKPEKKIKSEKSEKTGSGDNVVTLDTFRQKG